MVFYYGMKKAADCGSACAKFSINEIKNPFTYANVGNGTGNGGVNRI